LQPGKSGGFKKSLLFVKNQADLQNPCAFQKIRQIYKILALFQKSGGVTESLRFSKNQADLQNPCAFLKIRRICEIIALLQKPGGFTKSLRLTEKQADDRILAGFPRLVRKPAGLEKTSGPLTV
jgi:hypothetical protein